MYGDFINPNVEKQLPWLSFLTKKATDSPVQKFVSDVANILKDFLLSENDNAAAEAATKIDNYSVPSPCMHLSSVYWMIFDTAAVVPHNDPTQEKLLSLLIEILRLPPRKFETEAGIIAEEGPIYYEEFFSIFNESWNAKHVDELDLDYKTQDEYTQSCIEWVNLSAFFARCISSGFEGDGPSACKFPEIDIPDALEQEQSSMLGIDMDFRVMIATQYIIISGDKVKEVLGKFWDEHCDAWEKKLQEIEHGYENGFPEVASRFETPPGEKELTGIGDLGMDVLGSVKNARDKLRGLREGTSGQGSKETKDALVGSEKPAEEKDE